MNGMAMTPEQDIEQLWTIQQATEFLQCKRSWLYKQVREGNVPHIRMGGMMVRFIPEDLRKWVLGLKRMPLGHVVPFRPQR